MACACLFAETTLSSDPRTCLCGHLTSIHENGVGACRAGAVSSYSVVKTFVATRRDDREALGETITAWLAEHPQLEVVDRVVLQSSDAIVHCLSVVVFLRERAP